MVFRNKRHAGKGQITLPTHLHDAGTRMCLYTAAPATRNSRQSDKSETESHQVLRLPHGIGPAAKADGAARARARHSRDSTSTVPATGNS